MALLFLEGRKTKVLDSFQKLAEQDVLLVYMWLWEWTHRDMGLWKDNKEQGWNTDGLNLVKYFLKKQNSVFICLIWALKEFVINIILN